MSISFDKVDHVLSSYFYFPKKGEWQNKDIVRIASWATGGLIIGGVALTLSKSVCASRSLYHRVFKNRSQDEAIDRTVFFSSSSGGQVAEFTHFLGSSECLEQLEMTSQDRGINLRPELMSETIKDFVISRLTHTFGNPYINTEQIGDRYFTAFIQALKNIKEGSSPTFEKKTFTLMQLLYTSETFKQAAPDEYEKLSEYIEICFYGEKIVPFNPPSEEARSSRYCMRISRTLIDQMVKWVISGESNEVKMAAKSLLDHLVNPYTRGLFQTIACKNGAFQSAYHKLEEMEGRSSQTESDQSRLSVS
ncbi:MAG: hypothetical protein ACSNEK_08090 [Parachlamydiaceae bacterium]